MIKPKAILFDLGNTILKEGSFERDAGTAKLLEYANNPFNVTPLQIRNLVDELDSEIRPRCSVALIEFPTRIYQKLLYERLGISFDLDPAKLEEEFWNAAFSITLQPYIEDVMEALKEKEIPAGIVSNSAFSGSVLRKELEKQGLIDNFQFVMSSADYGFRKPHPVIFLTAASKLNLHPREIWFVGDSIRDDIVGSLGVGMVPVWYNPQNNKTAGIIPKFVYETWRDFAKDIKEL